MIASLPMYDRAETKAANDRLWQKIREHFGEGAPAELSRGSDPWSDWTAPDLVLSQTCGLPYRTRLHRHVALVGTPIYELDCEDGYYYSVLIIREDDPGRQLSDFATARFAFNDTRSQSGWAAPQVMAQGEGFTFGNLLKTGAHHASARAVADGRADIAALDAVSWAMMQRWDRFTTRLKPLCRTVPTPALPLIAARTGDRDRMARAVSDAIREITPQDRDTLLLRGLRFIPPETYLDVKDPDYP